MSVEQLVCDGTVIGFYQEFDRMKPNLIIYLINDDNPDQVAIFVNQGIQGEEPASTVVQVTMFGTPNGMTSPDDEGYFKRTDGLASLLRGWAREKNANIIDSDYEPQAVYDIHAESCLIGKEPVRR